MAGLIGALRTRLGGSSGGPTASIVQFEAVHEEVIPSVCRALQAQGITPTVYLNKEIATRRGDVFPHLCPGAFDYRYVNLSGGREWDKLKAKLRARQDAFVFINTMQRDGIARFAGDLDRPVMGIVHNPELFLKAEDCLALADRADVGLITLADHAASYMIARRPQLADRIATLVPVYWGETLAAPDAEAPRRRVVAPGSVNFKNRSYDFLFDAFAKTPELADTLEVRILGGGPDRAELETNIAEAGLSQAVTFSPLLPETGFVGHQAYFQDLRSAAFILPLLPPLRQDYRVYKITAAMSTAQGFCIPPLLDRWTAMVYRVPSLFVSGGSAGDALRQAAEISAEDYSALQHDLRTRHTRLLQRNTDEIGYLMGAIGLG